VLENKDLKNVHKEACLTVGNITAGTENQIQLVFNSNIIPSIMALTIVFDQNTRIEAIWCLCNVSITSFSINFCKITGSASPKQLAMLLENGFLKTLECTINIADSQLLAVYLEAIQNIMEAAENNLNVLTALKVQLGKTPVRDWLTSVENLSQEAQEILQEIYTVMFAEKY
jgi:hypothetical protein